MKKQNRFVLGAQSAAQSSSSSDTTVVVIGVVAGLAGAIVTAALYVYTSNSCRRSNYLIALVNHNFFYKYFSVCLCLTSSPAI